MHVHAVITAPTFHAELGNLSLRSITSWVRLNVPPNTLSVISGTGFYASNDPTNSVKALKEDRVLRIGIAIPHYTRNLEFGTAAWRRLFSSAYLFSHVIVEFKQCRSVLDRLVADLSELAQTCNHNDRPCLVCWTPTGNSPWTIVDRTDRYMNVQSAYLL